MRYMKSVNELLESVRELRKEIQRGEAPKATGTAEERKTATETMMHEELDRHLRYQVECRALHDWLNGKTDKKPPMADKILEKLSESPRQCTCVSGVVDDDCPLHKHLSPDLPLHVRVAKANKKHVMNGDIGWVYFEDNMPYPIPDYPNDLVAAMGALEEYCREHHLFPAIYFYERVPGAKSSTKYWTWDIQLRGEGATIANTIVDNQSLPQAICEAIVAHSEGR